MLIFAYFLSMGLHNCHDSAVFGVWKVGDLLFWGHFGENDANPADLDHFGEDTNIVVSAFLPDESLVALKKEVDPFLDSDLDVFIELAVVALNVGEKIDELLI